MFLQSLEFFYSSLNFLQKPPYTRQNLIRAPHALRPQRPVHQFVLVLLTILGHQGSSRGLGGIGGSVIPFAHSSAPRCTPL